MEKKCICSKWNCGSKIKNLWLPNALMCKTLNKNYKENQRLRAFKSLLSLLFTDEAALLCSVWGWFRWLLSLTNEDSRGWACLFVLQLKHTVLNMTPGSTEGLVSLWLLSGKHDYWSEWQIKAVNGAGGWVQGAHGARMCGDIKHCRQTLAVSSGLEMCTLQNKI